MGRSSIVDVKSLKELRTWGGPLTDLDIGLFLPLDTRESYPLEFSLDRAAVSPGTEPNDPRALVLLTLRSLSGPRLENQIC